MNDVVNPRWAANGFGPRLYLAVICADQLVSTPEMTAYANMRAEQERLDVERARLAVKETEP